MTRRLALTLSTHVLITLTLSSMANKKLQRLQNTAAQIVLPHLSQLPSTSLLRELHWLPVHSRIALPHLQLTYHWSPWLPSFVNQLLHPSRTLQSTNQLLLDCPRFSTEFCKRSFRYLTRSHPQSGMFCLLT